MSPMQQQYYNNTSNEDRGLHSLRRLELIQLSHVTSSPTTTSTFSCKSPSARQKKSVAGSWQKSIYKPNSSQSPINEKEARGSRLRASSLPNLALVVSNSSSPSVSVSSKEQHRPEEKPRKKQIEVAPGEFLPLIGAEETRDAVRERRTVHTTCLVCSHALVCAGQADCVLCPSCRVVSPITENLSRSPGKKRHYSFGGVGMGLLECEFIGLQQQLEQEALNNTIWRLGASMSSF